MRLPSSNVVPIAKSDWTEFENELRTREQELASLLPSHISRERFINTAIIAAKNNPDLVLCDRRSLHAAVTKAAEDGLQPDGREGVINVYNEQRERKKGNVVEKYWVKVACWIPMAFGIRKRAREICGMIIDAQIVCKNDTVVWEQGDTPKFIHKPTPLDGDPGKMIGAYAIFKQGDQILHREVMREAQIGKVKSCVKAKNGLLWTTFEDEAWRKTVLRRGIKSVPSVPDTLQRIITRDDDQYDMTAVDDTAKVILAAPDIPDDAPEPETETKIIPAESVNTADDPFPVFDAPRDPDAFLETLEAAISGCHDPEGLQEVYDANVDIIAGLPEKHRAAAKTLFEEAGP